MQTKVDRFSGQIVGGDYLAERLLGKGRLQAVYLARQISTQERVALTLFILPERFSADARERYLQRFQREASKLQALQHPHILPVQAYGVYGGCAYMITPYMTHGSLADILKDKQRLSHKEIRPIVEQAVAGLSYAHRRNRIHGTLKPANIVLQADKSMQVAGFGLMHIQQMSGIEELDHPFAHLLSIASTYVTPPAYLAPEVLRGEKIDARSDIYALGVILFESLCGQVPFRGRKPEEILRQIEQAAPPSLRTHCPDMPIALELVVKQALEREPQRRFAQVEELAEAFLQVSFGIERVVPSQPEMTRVDAQQENDSWQLLPPIVTGKSPAMPAEPRATLSPRQDVTNVLDLLPAREAISHEMKQERQLSSPLVPVSRPAQPNEAPPLPQTREIRHRKVVANEPERKGTVKPAQQVRWRQVPEVQERPVPLKQEVNWLSSLDGVTDLSWSPTRERRVESVASGKSRRGRKVARRRVLAMLAAGGATAAGLAFVLHPPLPDLFTQSSPTGNTQNTPTGVKTDSKPTPGNAGHIVSLPGSNQLQANSALDFTNPVDKKASILVRIANGQFVAYERACTHVGVNVYYDKGTQMLVCPAHGAVFDPARGGAVVQGPATRPLRNLSVRVSNDGTLTLL